MIRTTLLLASLSSLVLGCFPPAYPTPHETRELEGRVTGPGSQRTLFYRRCAGGHCWTERVHQVRNRNPAVRPIVRSSPSPTDPLPRAE